MDDGEKKCDESRDNSHDTRLHSIDTPASSRAQRLAAVMDGLIIAGRQGQPLMHSRFRKTSSLYPVLHASFLRDVIADLNVGAENKSWAYEKDTPTWVRDIPPVLPGPPTDALEQLEIAEEVVGEDLDEDLDEDQDEDERGTLGFREASEMRAPSIPDLPDEALAWSESKGPEHMPQKIEEQKRDVSESCMTIPGGSLLCHIMVGDVRFLCPISRGTDPLLAFAFLHKVVSILQEYLIGSTDPSLMTEQIISEHFDIVYELMEEMLDGEGHVLLTEVNALKDIVLPPSWLDKLIHTVGLSSSSEHARSSLASPLPWRRPNSKYAKNEVYLDMVESLQGIVDDSGRFIHFDLIGNLVCSARLSGMPELVVSFNQPQLIEFPAWHRCVRQRTWREQHKLSYVPPDGESLLGEFQIKHIPAAQLSSKSAAPSWGLAPPLSIFADIRPYDKAQGGIFFEIRVENNLEHGYDLQDVCIEWYVGEGVQGIDATTQVQSITSKSSISSDLGSVPNLSRTAGTMIYNRKNRLMRWMIPTILPASMSVLKGTILCTTTCQPAYALQAKFEVIGFSISGLRVTSIQLERESYIPTKGARLRFTGDLEWRLQ